MKRFDHLRYEGLSDHDQLRYDLRFPLVSFRGGSAEKERAAVANTCYRADIFTEYYGQTAESKIE
jgi:hypothetical protein